MWRLDCHFTWSFKPREGPAVCRAKEAPSFLSYFKTLSIGPTLGKEPAISRSAVECSTNRANPAAKCTCSLFYPQNFVWILFQFSLGSNNQPLRIWKQLMQNFVGKTNLLHHRECEGHRYILQVSNSHRSGLLTVIFSLITWL